MAFPVIALIVVTLLFIWYLRRDKGTPNGLKEIPGPKGLPLIGNIHQLGKNPNDKYCEWSKEYGDIFKVKIGGNTVVIISNPKWTKEMFSGDTAFTGKPHFDGFDLYLEDPHLGLLGSEGEMWEVHRRFLLRQLRDFGFGKSSMEGLIMDEVNEVLERLSADAGKPVSKLKEKLRLAVVNSLWTLLTNKRMKQDDPLINRIVINTIDTFKEVVERGALIVFLPWLRHIIPGLSGYNLLRNMLEENKSLFQETVDEHKAAFDENDLKDFIDVYLAEMKKDAEDPSSMFYGKKAERNLVSTLFDLFIAGSETTSNTLSWATLYLCKFSSVQKKLQKEIEGITGNLRKVYTSDRPDMPYTQAVIDEVLRYSSIVQDGVQHRALADREFHGYHIPKDAWLQPNYYYIHHDPQLWGDPEMFRPERFLSEHTTYETYERNENLQAFQVGRRQCVGESLARDSLFLYLTNIFQQFSIEFDPSLPEPSLDASLGIIRETQPYSVVMNVRSFK